jgi:hypothetical protein
MAGLSYRLTISVTNKNQSTLRLETRTKASGPELFAALERLLRFPQNQGSCDPNLLGAIMKAQQLVHKIRGRPVSGRRRQISA